MSRAVLADTGPLFAAVDPDDADHERAQHELKQLAREKRDVFLSFSTILETQYLCCVDWGRSQREIGWTT
jgi:predicted nucleic acid-binding protein